MSMRPPASRRVRTPAIALALLVIVQSGPGGLWILSWRGKRARYARCRLTPCRRRVSHNTLDAADGAHRLHRHFRRTLDQDVKIGSRRPVTLRHRKEGTDRASSLRSDERSRSPESAFTFAEIGVHGASCEKRVRPSFCLRRRGERGSADGKQRSQDGSDRHRRRGAGDEGVHGACLPVMRASTREEMRRISFTSRSSSRLFLIHSR